MEYELDEQEGIANTNSTDSWSDTQPGRSMWNGNKDAIYNNHLPGMTKDEALPRIKAGLIRRLRTLILY